MKKFISIILVCFLTGCGGGGDSSSTVTNESAAGIWKGTGVTSEDVVGEVIGLVASNGKAFFLTDLPALTYGDVSVSGSNFSFNGTGYGEGYGGNAVTMSGTVSSEASIDVSYSSPTEIGTISLSKADSSVGVYDRPSNLQKLEGIWNDTISDSAGAWIFNIQNNGSFSAIRASDNCTMDGEFATINSMKNEYLVSATVSLCNGFNGNYSGLAFTSDADTFTDNVISFIIANSENAGVFEPTKQ